MGTSGSEGGRQKPTSRKTGRALLSDPYTYVWTLAGFVYVAFAVDAYARGSSTGGSPPADTPRWCSTRSAKPSPPATTATHAGPAPGWCITPTP